MMNILSYEVSTERVKATSERWWLRRRCRQIAAIGVGYPDEPQGPSFSTHPSRGLCLLRQSEVITAAQQREAVPTGPDRVIIERWPVATTFAITAQ